jgi:hypothetical protein
LSTTLSGTGRDFKGTGAEAIGAPVAPDRGAVLGAPRIAETSLSRTYRLRLSLLGVAIALFALAICFSLGLLIVAGPFHTSPASLA